MRGRRGRSTFTQIETRWGANRQIPAGEVRSMRRALHDFASQDSCRITETADRMGRISEMIRAEI